jgi:hypothetical protein
MATNYCNIALRCSATVTRAITFICFFTSQSTVKIRLSEGEIKIGFNRPLFGREGPIGNKFLV